MADKKLLALLRQGGDTWNEWRRLDPRTRRPNLRKADLFRADLREVDFSRVSLIGADLGKADLSGACLSEANLEGADLGSATLYMARLSRADLSKANLGWANLSDAILDRVCLKSADLTHTNLNGAVLREVDLCDARLGGTVFANVYLIDFENLETCKHNFPSSIDFRTLQSSGPLPLSFLRGCGLPDNLIEYLPSLLNQPIQFYSCFLSHSSKDGEFAQRLYADLQDKGVRCWFAPEDLKIGERVRDTIDEVIRLRDKLLVVLSENSIASQWVEDEVEAALEEERKDPDRRTILFPVRIDDAVVQTDRAWARAIMRTRHIGDFSGWKEHDPYRKSLERLLRDLKPELERKPGREA